MKIQLASSNQGFTRPQWLLLICLCLVAFEGGVHFAKKRSKEKTTVVTKTITTNTVVTRLEPTPTRETNAPLWVLPDTNTLTVTNAVRPAPAPVARHTNTYKVASTAGGTKEWVKPESKPMESESFKRKNVPTNSFTTVIPGGPNNPGIRIAVP